MSFTAQVKRVYVAGPYSGGDPATNTRKAIDAADALLKRGYAPYIPHLNHFWHFVHPHSYETWIDLDLAYLKRCEAVLRLPGESPGADLEVSTAQGRGMFVGYSMEDFPPRT